MRKLIILGLIAATAMPATAMAQSRGEVRRDRQEVREQRQDLREARRYGDARDVRRERRDVQEARQELREDRRDWRQYRNSNRNVFRQGRYAAPRGYAYRPVAVGYGLNRSFYGQRYWIADPYRYRLPATRGNQRWVRYGDDVLLVNMRSGRVLAVHRNFFW